jgi:hypothetical protein
MTDFDREMREALRRQEPPRDLTGSVMARIEGPRRAALKKSRWVPAAAGIAAMLVLSVGGYRVYEVRKGEEYRKGQQAKQQVMLAMRVTAQKLAVAERKVSELNHRRIGYE